jgi:hypothetical protein
MLRSTYPSTSQNSNKRAEQVLSVLEPIIESNFNDVIFPVLAICDVFLDPWQLILIFFKRDLI